MTHDVDGISEAMMRLMERSNDTLISEMHRLVVFFLLVREQQPDVKITLDHVETTSVISKKNICISRKLIK